MLKHGFETQRYILSSRYQTLCLNFFDAAFMPFHQSRHDPTVHGVNPL